MVWSKNWTNVDLTMWNNRRIWHQRFNFICGLTSRGCTTKMDQNGKCTGENDDRPPKLSDKPIWWDVHLKRGDSLSFFGTQQWGLMLGDWKQSSITSQDLMLLLSISLVCGLYASDLLLRKRMCLKLRPALSLSVYIYMAYYIILLYCYIVRYKYLTCMYIYIYIEFHI